MPLLAVGLRFLASLGCIGAGLWIFSSDQAFGLLLFAIGAYGLVVLSLYRRRILS